MKRVKQILALLLTLALLLAMGGVAEEPVEEAEVIEAVEEAEEEVIEAVEPEPEPAPEAPAEPEAAEPAPALEAPVEEVLAEESEAAEPGEIPADEPVLMVDELAVEAQSFDASSDFVIENGVLVEYTGRDANVVIPDGVTSIGEQAFAANDFVKDVHIPEGVTSIGDSAFWSCRSLVSINLPDGLESIGANAFEVCYSLESITIPGSVKSIGESAFEECRSMHTIEIQEGVKEIPAGMCTRCGLTSLEIPGSVEKIGNIAFYYCEQMTSAIIPDSVTEIEAFAFQNCEALETVQLSRNLTKLNDATFAECTHLRTISLPEHLKEIGSRVFINCSSLESIVIPDGVKKIGQETFLDCTSLRSAEIPESVTVISAGAFSGCSALANVEIPDGVTNIGTHAFSGCTGLESIKLPKALKYLSGFDHCDGLREVIIPENVESMDDTFNFCKNLETVTVQKHPNPSVHISIAHNFENCPNLKDVFLPKRSYVYDRENTVIEGDTEYSYHEKEFVNCPQLTVHLYEGSDAEAYCKAYNIAYVYREDDLEPDLYVTCTPVTAKLTQNETVTLKASTVGLSKKESYSYSVDKSGAAFVSVSSAGKVTAKKPGVATITVKGKISKQTATCAVTVIPAPTKVKLSQTSASLTTDDDSLTLTASVAPAEAAQDVKWKSSDESVATVSDEGVVTPVGDGKATITATTVKKATDGKAKSAKLVLTVTDLHKPKSIVLDQEGTVTVNLNEGLPLSYALKPMIDGQEARSDVKWSIPKAQRKYATVDSNGVVHGVSEGTVTVTVKTVKKGGKQNKQLTDTVKVKVVDPKRPTKVSLDQSDTVLLNLGETLTLHATMTPETAESGLSWTTSSAKIATVDEATGEVHPVKEGTATITVTTSKKNVKGKKLSASVKVKVVDPKKPRSVTINGGEKKVLLYYKEAETLALTSAVVPETAPQEVTWSIPAAQQKIATVDKATGVVTPTGKSFGTVTVKATTTAKKSDKTPATATISVVVADPTVPYSVQIAPSGKVEMKVKEEKQFTATIEPETATTKNKLTWSIPSSQNDYATVDKATGLVKAKKAGTVKLTVKTANGKTATVTIKITE